MQQSGGRQVEITVMRSAALAILFFPVHILVRLYQYGLRLSMFWDARVDALLLARSFAYRSAETFGDLAAAPAPDAYDFKPPSKSGHEAMTSSAVQILRRDSRKSRETNHGRVTPGPRSRAATHGDG